MARSDTAPHDEIVIEREFEAPRALVFREWLSEESLRDWFAPDTYVTTACVVDARPGGEYRVDYRSETGHVFSERGTFLEIDEPNRLVLTLTHVDKGKSGPETRITVSFADSSAGTHVSFRQTGFASREHRDANAEGWLGCFAKLARRLTPSVPVSA